MQHYQSSNLRLQSRQSHTTTFSLTFVSILSTSISHLIALTFVFERVLSVTSICLALVSHWIIIFGLSTIITAAGRGTARAWKGTENFRNACFYHFITWILNPNALALLIFWPGWIIVLPLWLYWTWA
jgi:hypothetical protein